MTTMRWASRAGWRWARRSRAARPQLQELALANNALAMVLLQHAAAISSNALPNLAQLELEGDNNVAMRAHALDEAKRRGSEVEILFGDEESEETSDESL